MNYLDIDWEVGDRYDSAGDGYCYFHFLDGVDDNGNEYIASGTVVSGELVEVEDIERVEK